MTYIRNNPVCLLTPGDSFLVKIDNYDRVRNDKCQAMLILR